MILLILNSLLFLFANESDISFLDEQNSRLVYPTEQVLNNPYLSEQINLSLSDLLNLDDEANTLHAVRYKKINVQGKIKWLQVHSLVEIQNQASTEILCKTLLRKKQNEWSIAKNRCYLESNLVKRL